MRSAIVIGVLVFLILILVRIPAGVIQTFIPADSPVKLLHPEGTVWSGQGELLVDGRATGQLGWSIRPVTFLKGSVGYDLSLAGAGADLNGSLATGFGTTEASVRGTVTGDFVNRWLAPYYIALSGTFVAETLNLSLDGRMLENIEGLLTWNGGPIQYRLSGNVHNSSLPPMTAELGPGPVAVAFATGEPTPLLHVALAENGFVRIGVTKYLTTILGQPWPGGDPDHAVVLEVEEQVF